MAEQVKLPGIGDVDKRWAYAGAALIVGIVGYAWWRRNNSASVAADATVAQQAVGDYDNPAPVQSVIDTTNPEEIRTNVQWTEKVTAALGNLGFDSTYLATILGKYLSRQPLTLDEQLVIRTAWAYAGKPPEGPDTMVTSGGGGGATTPMHVTVNEGMHVDPWIANVNAGNPGLNLSRSKLLELNPGLPIAQANKFGYITAANPANRAGGGPVVDVFNVGTTRQVRIA